MKTSRLVVAAAQMKFRAAVADNVAWITEVTCIELHYDMKGSLTEGNEGNQD